MTLKKLVALVCVLFFLQSCAVKPPRDTAEPGEPTQDQPAAVTAPLTDTPQKYLALADQTSGDSRNQHLLTAARLYLDLHDEAAAQRALDRIDTTNASNDTLIERKITQANILTARGQPREALQLLVFREILKPAQQIRYLTARANAFLSAGYPFETAKTRVQLNTLLDDELDRELNNQAIWEALSLLPATTLRQLSMGPLHADLLGWLELAKIAKRAQTDWQTLQEDIFEWQQKYPQHPAADEFARELGLKQIELMERPQHIAVLLPLTGRYAHISAAIRNGLMSAYYTQGDADNRPRLTFIDTGKNPQAIWNHYRKAIDEGAEFIIGPFLKSAVSQLAQASMMEVPTLTLNYAQQVDRKVDNLFQFGLLPEDEARQVAEMAYHHGNMRASVLVPEGEWGQRLLSAFQLRFEDLGGKLVSSRTYVPGKNDFKQPIQSLLNINQSHARHRKLDRVIGKSTKFTPYRRQDVDMIFMAATSRDARQLKPQFKFHYAGELPVYATSHAFSGKLNKQADRDIDELFYCDIPWILNPSKSIKQSLETYWPEQKRVTRFFALGSDAYNLIPFLSRLQARSYERFSGQTGNLYLDPYNQIHRELLWAQFVRGVPTLLDISQLPESMTFDQDTVQ